MTSDDYKKLPQENLLLQLADFVNFIAQAKAPDAKPAPSSSF